MTFLILTLNISPPKMMVFFSMTPFAANSSCVSMNFLFAGLRTLCATALKALAPFRGGLTVLLKDSLWCCACVTTEAKLNLGLAGLKTGHLGHLAFQAAVLGADFVDDLFYDFGRSGGGVACRFGVFTIKMCIFNALYIYSHKFHIKKQIKCILTFYFSPEMLH